MTSELLSSSWKTFMCRPVRSAEKPSSPEHLQRINHGSSQHKNALSVSSTQLWLLSLVARSPDLVRVVSQLMLQFNEQYRALRVQHEEELKHLRQRHAQQMSDLLEADGDSEKNMIVTSSVTQQFVLRQQREIDAAIAQREQKELECERQLQHTLLTMLEMYAPDAMQAISHKSAASSSSNSNTADTARRAATSSTVGYHPEVDISRFASGPFLPGSKAKPTTTTTTAAVPTRTVLLANQLWEPSKKKGSGAMPQSIVLDVSPVSSLKACLMSCSARGTPSVGAAAEAHLMRLAHAKHSLLFLIGTERAALDLIRAGDTPELLMGDGSCKDGFHPLPSHPSLKMHVNTRLWGANIVLLWSPQQQHGHQHALSQSALSAASTPKLFASLSSGSSVLPPPVVNEVLGLAFAWNIDMLSVAVLESNPKREDLVGSRGGTPSGGGGPQRSGLSTYVFSMDVVRELQHGLASILLEVSARRRTPLSWMVHDDDVVSRQYAASGIGAFPRAVGARYSGLGDAAAAGVSSSRHHHRRRQSGAQRRHRCSRHPR